VNSLLFARLGGPSVSCIVNLNIQVLSTWPSSLSSSFRLHPSSPCPPDSVPLFLEQVEFDVDCVLDCDVAYAVAMTQVLHGIQWEAASGSGAGPG
jgi:hypothetical protein